MKWLNKQTKTPFYLEANTIIKEQENDDTIILHNSLQTKPAEEIRRPTNVYFLFIFGLMVLIWLGIGMYAALSDGPTLDPVYEKTPNLYSNLTTSTIGTIIGYMALATLLMFVYLFMLKGIAANFFVGMALFCNAALIILTIVATFNFIYLGEDSISFLTYFIVITMSFIYAIYKVSVFICVQNDGVKIISAMIKESCRAIFNYPSIFPFYLVILILELLVLSITIAVLNSIDAWQYTDTDIYIFTYTIASGFILSFIAYFAQMTISQCVAKWYWTEDKKEISHTTILRSIATTSRYHLGTIAFGSTYFFPVIQAIFLTFTYKSSINQNSNNRFIKFISKIHMIFTIPDLALIPTSIHGYNFNRSIKETFDLMIPNSSRYLAVVDIASTVVYIGGNIIGLIIGLVAACILHPNIKLLNDDLLFILITIAFATSFSICFLILFMLTSVKTILFCTLEDLNNNDGTVKKPYCMNNELKQILAD